MKFKKEIEKLIKNVDKIPEKFWQTPRPYSSEETPKTVCWFMDRQKPSVEPDYSFDEERFAERRFDCGHVLDH